VQSLPARFKVLLLCCVQFLFIKNILCNLKANFVVMKSQVDVRVAPGSHDKETTGINFHFYFLVAVEVNVLNLILKLML